jgi:hypothetical protein
LTQSTISHVTLATAEPIFAQVYSTLLAMGRKAPSEEELAERALANGFVPEAHRAADAERDQGKHIGKTMVDQNRTLTRYVA